MDVQKGRSRAALQVRALPKDWQLQGSELSMLWYELVCYVMSCMYACVCVCACMYARVHVCMCACVHE